MDTCFLCRKHNGQEAAPPGAYIYEDEHWMVCSKGNENRDDGFSGPDTKERLTHRALRGVATTQK